jgi:RimJ/RimL family protein N-acetyltransferase
MTLVLVPFGKAHLANSLRWVTDPQVREGMLIDRQITPESHNAWFEAVMKDPAQAVYAAIAQDIHVGNFGFRHLSPQGRSGELWMYLGPEHQRQRLSSPLLQAGLREGVGPLALGTIDLHVRADNAIARALYERAGFQVARIEAGARMMQGRAVDVVHMVLHG